MATDYSELGYDANGLKQFQTGVEKSVLSPLEADSQFGDGSLPGLKLQSGPNLSTFGFPDNFDSSYPFILPYYVDSSAKVTRATISLFFQPYRAYETAASSGGGSTSGSSSSSTTSGGGGQTSSSTTQTTTVTTTDTSGQTAHSHAYALYGTDNASPDVAKGPIYWEATSDPYGRFVFNTSIGAGVYKWSTTNTTVDGHSHNVTLSNPSHSHTVSDHTHGMGHTHSTPDHTHGITYGIYSSGYPANVSMTIDGVDVTTALGGPWNPNVSTPSFVDLDITQYTGSSGSHTIQLTTTTQGRCIPMLIVKSVLGSRS